MRCDSCGNAMRLVYENWDCKKRKLLKVCYRCFRKNVGCCNEDKSCGACKYNGTKIKEKP